MTWTYLLECTTAKLTIDLNGLFTYNKLILNDIVNFCFCKNRLQTDLIRISEHNQILPTFCSTPLMFILFLALSVYYSQRWSIWIIIYVTTTEDAQEHSEEINESDFNSKMKSTFPEFSTGWWLVKAWDLWLKTFHPVNNEERAGKSWKKQTKNCYNSRISRGIFKIFGNVGPFWRD